MCSKRQQHFLFCFLMNYKDTMKVKYNPTYVSCHDEGRMDATVKSEHQVAIDRD